MEQYTNLNYLEDVRDDVHYLQGKIYKKVRNLLEAIERHPEPVRYLANIIFLLAPKVEVVYRDLEWSKMEVLPGVKIRFVTEFMGKPVDNTVAIIEVFGKDGSLDPSKQVVFGKEVSRLIYRLLTIEDNRDYSGSLYEKLLETEKEEK